MSELKKASVLMICLIFLTGCWDKVEIEDRAFVYGIAVDLTENNSSTEDRVELTQQLIVPSALSTIQGGGSGGGPAFRNLSAKGNNLFDINREIIRQASRTIDVTHLNVVLLSEDVSKEPKLFARLMDVFLREKDMRRGIKVGIASGKASELLTVLPEHEKVPTEYISKMLEERGNLEFLEVVKIGDLHEKLLTKESFPLPQLRVKNPTVIIYEGIAVYNGDKEKVVGTLKDKEAKGLSFFLGKPYTGTINVKVEGKLVTIEILNIKSEIAVKNNDIENLKFLINVKIDGTISEQFGTEDIMKTEVFDMYVEGLKKEVEDTMMKTFSKLQNDLQTDILGLGNNLHLFHPKLWKMVKNDWDRGENYFSKCSIDVKVNVKIDKPGSIIKSAVNGGSK